MALFQQHQVQLQHSIVHIYRIYNNNNNDRIHQDQVHILLEIDLVKVMRTKSMCDVNCDVP